MNDYIGADIMRHWETLAAPVLFNVLGLKYFLMNADICIQFKCNAINALRQCLLL